MNSATTDLDKLSDNELNEVFAAECCDFKQWPLAEGFWEDADGNLCPKYLNKFATSADAVLPRLPKHWKVEAGILYDTGPDHKITAHHDTVIVKVKDGKASAPTFARAACIALIRAKRAQKEGA